jgi:hypothetical protein
MKDISELGVTQIRIFSAGMLPYPHLKVSTRLKALADQFSFSSAGIDRESGEVLFEGGLFGNLVVERAEFGERRIAAKVLGNSMQASEFYEHFAESLTKIAETEGGTFPKPVLLVQETSCTVKLGFGPLALLSAPTRALLQDKVLAACSDKNADAQISQLKLRIELSYREKSGTLTAHKIGLAAKTFVLEPKANTPFDEHIFFTSSPTDSDTHIRLIGEFEQALASR